MKDKLRPLLTETIRLIIAAFLSIILAKLLFSWTDFNGVIDIPLHDTYFVFSIWLVLIPLFLFITFVIYFIKKKFK